MDGDKPRTTTEIMLGDIHDKRAHAMTEARCPKNHSEREKGNYIAENPFSLHDNRHTIQDKGEYFLQGLGRKKATSIQNQHKSANVTEWKTPGDRDPNYSIYRGDFLADMNTKQPTKRRFHKNLPAAKEGFVKLEPSVIKWVDQYEEPDPVSVQVLADSQEPYLPHNSWRYSYHRHSFAVKEEKKK